MGIPERPFFLAREGLILLCPPRHERVFEILINIVAIFVKCPRHCLCARDERCPRGAPASLWWHDAVAEAPLPPDLTSILLFPAVLIDRVYIAASGRRREGRWHPILFSLLLKRKEKVSFFYSSGISIGTLCLFETSTDLYIY